MSGLTKDADGTISIGGGGLEKALADQAAEMKKKQDELNEELASGRKPGSPAGDDTVGNKDNS